MANTFTEKSNETWKEGLDCLASGSSNMAANRLYYSVFQAIKGFAIARKLWSPDEKSDVHKKALDVVCGHAGGKGHGSRQKLSELRGLREIADYWPENVDIEELKALITDADMIRKHHIKNAVEKAG